MKKEIIIASLIAAMPLSAEMNVLAFAGSTRTDSHNKQLVREAAEIARQMGANVTIVDLKDFPMPFYDADLEKEKGLPENAKRLRQMMIKSDAMIIASPEYNASITAVLKNTIDWCSRGEDGKGSKEAFKGKHIAIMSAAAGKAGGAHSLAHLRAILSDVGAEPLTDQVEIARVYETSIEKEQQKKVALKKQLQQLILAQPAPQQVVSS
ncbi:MAG: NAD(P)H-dependent oxidoreductase [Candidatus Melainabacteria bacterium]|nr:NAD(P)H-dependent oxidoreductase [Candidatus Melainabacteria bacterium]